MSLVRQRADVDQAVVAGVECGCLDRDLGDPRAGWELVQRDWDARYPGSSWERVKTAVRRGWERTTEAVERAIPGDSDHDGR